ncbi:hypothetical protein [Streptomyces sp. NBC_01244]|uniref:hypothetical protein n=1 Tax=Streptomyces sp. NBC_01244 TaxID=2903797 RepID=UPI002E15E444|nr:hypothetical protein OG247_13850 [Streptomyces sp. NBC_01244]
MSENNGTPVSEVSEVSEPAEPTEPDTGGVQSAGSGKSSTAKRLKVLAVVAAGVGVLVAGGMLAPEKSRATLRANWVEVPRSRCPSAGPTSACSR